MPLHIFFPGESAQVAENLNADFNYLLQLIQSSLGGSSGLAFGSSTAIGIGSRGATATASGTSTANGVNGASSINQTTGTAVGTSSSNFILRATAQTVGSATGSANVQAFSNSVSVATATGTSSTNMLGGHINTYAVTATGTSTASGVGRADARTVGTATGTSTAAAINQNPLIESNDQTVITQATQQINASTIPGQASVNLNVFTLPTNPGVVQVNGSNDTSASNTSIVELAYFGHVVYRQNSAGNWFTWVSANTWNPASSPFPVVILESVEGTFVTQPNNIIYGSSTVGVAAPIGSGVGSGLDTWALSPVVTGVVLRNGVLQNGQGGSSLTSNVTQLYYHNHTISQQNMTGNWFAWNGTGWIDPSPSPIPASATINVQDLPNQNVDTTFVVSGTYQSGPPTPVLQYADNATTASQTTTFDPANKTTSMALANGNLTASSSVIGADQWVRSTTSFNAGKKVFEFTNTSFSINWIGGIGNGTATGPILGTTANSIGIQPNHPFGQLIVLSTAAGGIASQGTGNLSVNGEAVTIAIDFTAKLAWFTTATMRAAFPTGTGWNNSNTATPETGTGGIAFTATGPFFITFYEFDNNGACRINTAGPFVVTPSVGSGFTAWDTGGGTTTWLSFPSNVNVTQFAWNFVHPPVHTQTSQYRISVRDSVSPGVIGAQPNTFQVSIPGVLTIQSMSLSNNTVTANQAGGAFIGTVTILVTGGTFTGTVECSDAARFVVNGTGGTRTLATNSVLGTAGSPFPLTLTARMQGAVNDGLQFVVPGGIIVSSESAQATDVTTIGPTIVSGSTPGTHGATLTWALVAGGRMSLNGVTQSAATLINITRLYYIAQRLYILRGSNWSTYNATNVTGQQTSEASFTSSGSPVPVMVLSGSTFPSGVASNPSAITGSFKSNNTELTPVTWTTTTPGFSFTGAALNTPNQPNNTTTNVSVTATIPA